MKRILFSFFLAVLAVSKSSAGEPLPAAGITSTPVATAALAASPTPAVTAAPAAPPQAALPPGGKWVVQLDGSLEFPLGNFANNVDLGFGGEGAVGYQFDGDFALYLESGYETFHLQAALIPTTAVSNATWNYIPLVLKAQRSFGNGPVRPYLSLGGGLAINTLATSAIPQDSASETDLLAEGGLGFSFAVSDGLDIFLQGRLVVDFTSPGLSVNDSTIPLSMTLPQDRPTLLVPVQAGVQWDLK